jgi:cyclin-dependent kinase
MVFFLFVCFFSRVNDCCWGECFSCLFLSSCNHQIICTQALDRNTGGVVALKNIKLREDDEGVPATTIREISLLKRLQHDNVVKLQDVITDQSCVCMVFEYLDSDLKNYLDAIYKLPVPKPMGFLLIKSYLYQLISAMAHCHAVRVIHRDLKPQNVLLNKEGRLKIADFGLGRACGLIQNRVMTAEVVTLWYRAPEILLGCEVYTEAVDMWSIGCIFAELFQGTPLFPGDSEIDQTLKIFYKLGTPTEQTFPGFLQLVGDNVRFPSWTQMQWNQICPRMCEEEPHAIQLLQKLLTYDPRVRITAANALLHPYFDSIRPLLAQLDEQQPGALITTTAAHNTFAPEPLHALLINNAVQKPAKKLRVESRTMVGRQYAAHVNNTRLLSVQNPTYARAGTKRKAE